MSLNNKVLICLIVIVIFSSVGCSKKPEVHSFDFPPTIFWNDTLYYVEDISHSSASIEEINKKIGEIQNVVDASEKPKTNGSANIFEKGCNIYTYKGKNEEKMIVIEYEELYYIASPKSD